MQDLNEFRLFYNRTLYPELVRQERIRKRLIVLFVLSLLVLAVSGWAVYYLKMPVLALLIWIPFTAYSSFLGWRIRKFIAGFKPKVVQLILDFIVHPMTYSHKAYLPKERFLQSRFFMTEAPHYKGEDFIAGQIGSLHFEMCELDVRDQSKVSSNAMMPVFRGIFFIAKTEHSFNGEIVILPKSERPYLTRAIKDLIRREHQALKVKYPGFNDKFLSYINPYANEEIIIPKDFYERLFNFSNKINKKVYMSFVEGYIYIAVWEPKDILEPHIFRSNTSFKLVNEFYTDLYNIVSLMEEFESSESTSSEFAS